jgi:hypothetical protein
VQAFWFKSARAKKIKISSVGDGCLKTFYLEKISTFHKYFAPAKKQPAMTYFPSVSRWNTTLEVG